MAPYRVKMFFFTLSALIYSPAASNRGRVRDTRRRMGKKRENVKEDRGIELRMGARQEKDDKRKHGYTTQSLSRVCLWQGKAS